MCGRFFLVCTAFFLAALLLLCGCAQPSACIDGILYQQDYGSGSSNPVWTVVVDGKGGTYGCYTEKERQIHALHPSSNP